MTTKEIETETRTRTETEIVEHEEQYEVATCEWCDGEHPTTETVAVGIGVEETRRKVEDVEVDEEYAISTHSSVSTARAKREMRDTLSKPYVTAYATVEEPREQVPFCAWCAKEVFGMDVETVLDAPAFDYYDQEQGGTDGVESPSDLSGTNDGQNFRERFVTDADTQARWVVHYPALFTPPIVTAGLLALGVPLPEVVLLSVMGAILAFLVYA